jgi:hypothetical protein
MDTSDLLTDHFGRIRELFASVTEGLSVEDAHRRPEGHGNPIVWLLWHSVRIQDDHLSGLTGEAQAWHDGWADRFDLPYETDATGYGHSQDEVSTLRVEDLQLLVDYQEEVHRRTLQYVAGADADELDRVVDEHWDPPVTAGVRLVSVIGDELQHLGQAAYLKGLPPSAG